VEAESPSFDCQLNMPALNSHTCTDASQRSDLMYVVTHDVMLVELIAYSIEKNMEGSGVIRYLA
jgi:hypothetical protein